MTGDALDSILLGGMVDSSSASQRSDWSAELGKVASSKDRASLAELHIALLNSVTQA